MRLEGGMPATDRFIMDRIVCGAMDNACSHLSRIDRIQASPARQFASALPTPPTTSRIRHFDSLRRNDANDARLSRLLIIRASPSFSSRVLIRN